MPVSMSDGGVSRSKAGDANVAAGGMVLLLLWLGSLAVTVALVSESGGMKVLSWVPS